MQKKMDVMNFILSRSGRGYFGCGHLFPTNEFVGYWHIVPNGTPIGWVTPSFISSLSGRDLGLVVLKNEFAF